MAKKAKAVQAVEVAAVVEQVQAVTEVASVATKLTKRNATPIDKPLALTDKAPKSRAGHVKDAWGAVVAALPATATELAKLEPLQAKGCVSPQAFLSYMLRRGFLKVAE